MPRQLLLSNEFKTSTEHGGSMSIGRRKKSRSIATKKPMHIVMKSSSAHGSLCLLYPRNLSVVLRTLQSNSTKYSVRILEKAVQTNHIHLLLQPRDRQGLRAFLRVLCGTIALKVTGARKGKPNAKRFWDLLVWSKIIHWGKHFDIVRSYIVRNIYEAYGLIPYVRPQKSKSRIIRRA